MNFSRMNLVRQAIRIKVNNLEEISLVNKTKTQETNLQDNHYKNQGSHCKRNRMFHSLNLNPIRDKLVKERIQQLNHRRMNLMECLTSSLNDIFLDFYYLS